MNVRTRQTRSASSVSRVLTRGGHPLPAPALAMGRRSGHDFSSIRIHSDDEAAASAKELGARAYTAGKHIVFARGAFQPDSDAGRKTIAHELAHTLQQSSAEGTAAEYRIGSPHDVREREADALADRMLMGAAVPSPWRSVERGLILRQPAADAEPGNRPGCTVRTGIPPTNCGAYASNAWWLPLAYVNNATCACTETPNSPTANCVRAVLQERLRSTSSIIKTVAAGEKPFEVIDYALYQGFVQAVLTPIIYADHVAAYNECCCSSGPAVYPAWVGVTSVPLPCSAVGESIRQFGSCHGTPGRW